MLSLLPLFSYAEEDQAISQQQQGGMQGTNQQNMCSSLSPNEQQFAMKLNSSNRMMFCNRFSKDIRNQTMQMTKQTDASGKMMTPDQAVEKMAKSKNMTPQQQMQGSQSQSGSCPVQ